MERDIDKSPSEIEAGNDKFFNTTQEKNTEIDKDKIKKQEFNSWDCSTPSTNEENPRKKKNDWDSSSECQEETLVEPFDCNAKDCDNWNSSESEDKSVPKFSFGRNKELGEHSRSSSLSSGLFIADSSEVDKNSSIDMFKIIGSDDEKSRNSSRKNYVKNEDDLLLVEDIEEFLRDEDLPKTQQSKEISPATAENSNSGTGSEKVRSNHSEGTTDDTTIWMIPKSERTLSADSFTKLMSCSDREIETVNNFNISLKKAKSLSDTQKCKSQRKSIRSSRSDRLGLVHSNKNNLDCFLVKYEGSSLQKNLNAKSKTKKEGISHSKCFDRTAVFFTEYECRAMTMDKDAPEKSLETSANIFGSTENIQPQVAEESSNDDPDKPTQETRNSEAAVSEMALAGPPASTSLDVVSLPDMRGRNALKTPTKEKFTRRVTNPEKGKIENQKPQSEQSVITNQLNESWFLLDETGQYQAVTKNEVTILLNGRSADAVLQGKKEHVIPNANLGDLTSPHSSISGMITKESLQNFLREEDIGGEDNGKKLDLERKVENTLLYIQPGMNLTASIRIIPVDTEMIHIWRRTRDSGSMLSSEVDLRFHPSQESFENTGQKNFNRQTSFIPRMAMNNSHQTLDELDETLLTETPREENISSNQMENSDYSSLLLETRMIVDSLTNNFKTLQNRLDGESSKSSALQTEVSKLRNLLKNIGGKSFFDKSFRETISDHQFLQSDVSSSISLLTVKGADKADIKSESVLEEASEVDPVFQSSVDIPQDDAGSRCLSQNKESRGLIRNGVQSECLSLNTAESACLLKNVSKSRCLLDDVAECRSLLQDIESKTLIQKVVDYKSESKDMSESKSLTRDNSKSKTSPKNVFESALQDELEAESLPKILKKFGSPSKSKSSFLEEAEETESLSKGMAESGRLPEKTSEFRSLSKDKMESKSSAEEVKTELLQTKMSESKSLSRNLRNGMESKSLSQNISNYKSASKDEMEKDTAQHKPQLKNEAESISSPKDQEESKSKTGSRSSSKDEIETKSVPKNTSEIKSFSKGLEESRSSLKSEKETKSFLKDTPQFRDEGEDTPLLKDSAQLISQSRREIEDKLSSKDLLESCLQIKEEVEIRSLSRNLAEATSFLRDKAKSGSISLKEAETKSISNGIKETRSQSRDEIEYNSLTKNSVESKSMSNSSRNKVDIKLSPKDMTESRSLLKHQTETKSLSRSMSGSRSSSKSAVEPKPLVEDESESKSLISSSKGMAESKSIFEEEVETKLLSRDMEDHRSISSGSERSRSTSKYKIIPKNKVDHPEIPEMFDEPECSYGNSAESNFNLPRKLK